MEELIFIIIVIAVVIINIFRKMSEYNRDRPGSDSEGWEEWQSEETWQSEGGRGLDRDRETQRPTTAQQQQQGGRGTQPSDRVRKILQQLEQMESGQRPTVQKTPPPTPTPAPRPIPAPPPRPKPVPRAPEPRPIQAKTVTARPEIPHQTKPYAEPTHRRYLGEEARKTADSLNQDVEADLPSRTSDEAAANVARESLARAFPSAMRMVRATRVGARRPIVINATGQGNLRRAIILSEVLGQPRAFDV